MWQRVCSQCVAHAVALHVALSVALTVALAITLSLAFSVELTVTRAVARAVVLAVEPVPDSLWSHYSTSAARLQSKKQRNRNDKTDGVYGPRVHPERTDARTNRQAMQTKKRRGKETC